MGLTTVPVAASGRMGLIPHHHRADGPEHAPTISALLSPGPWSEFLDPRTVPALLGGAVPDVATCARGVLRVRPDHEVRWHERAWREVPLPRRATAGTLAAALHTALARAPEAGLALSGGLDSALLLALSREVGLDLPVYVLDARLHGYRETERAQDAARALGARDVRLVTVEERDFLDALPDTIRSVEVPLWNVHPVSKLLLARAVRSDGLSAVVTGDGADEVFAGRDGRDYLPLVGSQLLATGVQPITPFLDPDVRSLAEPRPGKPALRALATGRLPDALVTQVKVPRLAPPVDLSVHWRPRLLDDVARWLGCRPPRPDAERARTRWTTLGLLVDAWTRPGS